LILARHLTRVEKLMTLSTMKLLVLWSVQVRTEQKRKEREEVHVIFLKILSICLNDVYVLNYDVYVLNYLKHIETVQKLLREILPIYG
jgi:hypothetical protein